jgi:hypothetical protein
MKNDQLEPIEQAGLLIVFVGLDLMVNQGKITSSVLNMCVSKQNEFKDLLNEKQ